MNRPVNGTITGVVDGASAGAAAPVLVVDGLCVEFAGKAGWERVVDDVSFAVRRGETLAIVGESGSGKSVTSLACMGLLPASACHRAGRIVLGGTDVASLSRRQLEDVRGDEIAMIFQEPMTSLDPAFRVGDQIAEVVRRHRGTSWRQARARAVEVLDIVGIPRAADRARSYPHEFSGGMRQRVMIAMAISCEPAVLIADEPTTALDVTIQAQVLDLLRRMKAEFGMALVLVTHDLGVVADVADRVAVMYAGSMVEEASVDDLFYRTAHPYTQGLLSSMPQVHVAGEQPYVIPGRMPSPSALPPGCRFAPRCAYAIDACDEGLPALRRSSTGHAARCFRSDELELYPT
ncbi:MAG TPA: ABC transporter ATP-binding protein [Ilumatobacter sp.]|nr:ABC transporter ATP-binding protein [Ilumatobacter sp.]